MRANGDICYMQWLIPATENGEIQANFGSEFPLLNADEALLEGTSNVPHIGDGASWVVPWRRSRKKWRSWRTCRSSSAAGGSCVHGRKPVRYARNDCIVLLFGPSSTLLRFESQSLAIERGRVRVFPRQVSNFWRDQSAQRSGKGREVSGEQYVQLG
jgi:hypothetical protein